ncbi:MAG: hypothetical protein KDB50_04805 [Mycobacterium sp.]|nr:hypothetical protein [Mycobacterium sp.]
MTTPAIGSADSPDADGGSADTRRAAASAPATAGRSLRAHTGVPTTRPRPHTDSPVSIVRRHPGAANSLDVRDLVRSPLVTRAAGATVDAALGEPSEPSESTVPAHSQASTQPPVWEAGLAWLRHTFDNATPTFAGQRTTVNVAPGQNSAPITLGGFDADGDPLAYSVSGANSATGSAGGVLSISGGTATYAPPDAWDGTAGFDDDFLVTVSDAGAGWHLHGLAGLLNLLTFGMFGSPGDSATGTLTVQVRAVPGAGPEPPGTVPEPTPEPPAPAPDPADPDPPVASPEPPVAQPEPPGAEPDPPPVEPGPGPTPPGVAGSFPVSFVNGNGTYTGDQIHVMVIGQASPGQWSWIDSAGTAHPIDHAAANAADHLVKDGINYANMSFTVAEAGNLRIPPELLGGRIYVSLGEPLYVAISPDNTGWAGPDPANPADPNYRTVYDWYELSFKNSAVPFGGNTTQVDQFGFPYTFTLSQESTGYSGTRGITVSRDELFRRFEATMPTAFHALIIDDADGDPLRILAPRSHQPGELATWFDDPIDDFWMTYSGEQFVYNGPGFAVTGGVDADNRFAYTVTAAGGAVTTYTMSKPTTAEVFRADGPFVGTGLQGAFLAHLDAAFHRGVASAPQNWDTASAYYPSGGRWNNWSQFFHANSVDGYAYGFPYDDVNSQSSVLILNNPAPLSNLTIVIGG